MKIGVIGLGNIAQKAYLPSYIALQDQADFILPPGVNPFRKNCSNVIGWRICTPI